MNKIVKIGKLALDILCWAVIVLLLVTVVYSTASKLMGTYPSVFGYSILRVSSPSMEPQLSVGDIILGKSVNSPENIKVGDTVTYRGSGELTGMYITHKVIVAPYYENGKLMLQTQGVANSTPDTPILAESVSSVVVCKLSFLNGFYNFFYSPWGLITVIALVIIIFIDELIRLVKALLGVGENKPADDINEIILNIKNEDKDS